MFLPQRKVMIVAEFSIQPHRIRDERRVVCVGGYPGTIQATGLKVQSDSDVDHSRS
jgi:hypothetical protein